jgi:hypothetical protein
MLKRLILMIAIFGFVSCTLADTPFDGKWMAETVRPAPAGKQSFTITLKTDKGKVTGSLLITEPAQEAGETPIEWGMVKGDLITFKVKMPFTGVGANASGTATFVYLGKIEGDQLDLGRRPEDFSMGGLREMTAARAK